MVQIMGQNRGGSADSNVTSSNDCFFTSGSSGVGNSPGVNPAFDDDAISSKEKYTPNGTRVNESFSTTEKYSPGSSGFISDSTAINNTDSVYANSSNIGDYVNVNDAPGDDAVGNTENTPTGSLSPVSKRRFNENSHYDVALADTLSTTPEDFDSSIVDRIKKRRLCDHSYDNLSDMESLSDSEYYSSENNFSDETSNITDSGSINEDGNLNTGNSEPTNDDEHQRSDHHDVGNQREGSDFSGNENPNISNSSISISVNSTLIHSYEDHFEINPEAFRAESRIRLQKISLVEFLKPDIFFCCNFCHDKFPCDCKKPSKSNSSTINVPAMFEFRDGTQFTCVLDEPLIRKMIKIGNKKSFTRAFKKQQGQILLLEKYTHPFDIIVRCQQDQTFQCLSV